MAALPDTAAGELVDFGQWLWGNRVREHRRLIVIVRYLGSTEERGKRLVLGRILLAPVDAALNQPFSVKILTRQTERQIKQSVAPETYECAVDGFLSPTLVSTRGERCRPIIGRVGLRGPQRRELERRRDDSARAGL